MAYPPKTPTRHRSRSETKTPLSSSFFGTNNLADASNPFIVASRPPSPVKRSIPVSETLQRQASAGVIRRGGVESRLDVVTRDYVPPPPKSEKRSRSQPSRDNRDRFITTRDPADEVAATLDLMSLNPESASPGHTARLAAATGVPLNRRILAYHEPPPAASSDPLMAQARELVRPLYARAGSAPAGSSGTTGSKDRKISTYPYKILDAPGMQDDFYLNLISWSATNAVGIALGNSAYMWKAESGEVVLVSEGPEGSYIASLDFSNDGQFLGVGYPSGAVELWDVETQTKLRTMGGHAAQVGVLAWNGHILSSGCQDGSIWHHDVRVARHKVGELLGHQGEVCGLRWRPDGELLASGGNDNVLNVWDGRVGDAGNEASGSRTGPRWTKRNHTAAVKAVAWCPWQPALLASGGGTSDATVHIWNTTTGARLHSLVTPAQISSIQWGAHKKEFLTTHGYPTNAIMVHSYPGMEKVAEIKDAHDSRVLFSAVSPNGELVATAAGDENLKFWKIWDAPKVRKKEAKEARGLGSSNSGILSIRSDPEVARLASLPSVTPQTRPVSDPSISHIAIHPLLHSHSVADLLVPIAPLSPLELSAPISYPDLPSEPSQPLRLPSFVAPLAHTTDRPQAQAGTERCARQHGPAASEELDAVARVASLKAALTAERIAREVAEEACAEYAEQVVALQDEVVQLRQALFASVAGDLKTKEEPSFASMFDSIMDTPGGVARAVGGARDPAPEAERDRLRHFVQLMIAVGGHKPVVDAAYTRVAQGEDAEAALVAAIKDAVRHPGSVWRGLLEPLTGPRTQDVYTAQVRCTLDARRQTTDWRKRTAFWKVKAKEGGRNAETVTPSVSAISAVVDAIAGERATGVQGTRAAREAPFPMLDVAIPRVDLGERQRDDLTPTASQFVLDMVAHWSEDEPEGSQDSSLPACSSSMVLPIATRPPSVDVAEPQLASSASRSAHSTVSAAPTHAPHRYWRSRSSAESARSSGSGSGSSSSCGSREAAQQSGVSEASTATAVASPGAAFSPLPQDLVKFGKGSEEDFVLVLHNDFSDTSHGATQPAPAPAPEPEYESESESESEREREGAGGTTRNIATKGGGAPGSPEKRSRLPVRMRSGLRLRVIKRISTTFSISRPTVAEAKETNACATAVVGVGAMGTRKDDGALGRAGTVGMRGKAAAGAGAEARDRGGSTGSQTRIPMGRRLQRFGM
ncbi:hypothetical protein DICSQDRAFT_128148 [Dichomitus squalens LYAD-421 SS1]|uniref:CDC20/Fizzy WD40 domain-containing protein n=1 Tax=Dichomitus squalens (strain LYAD-421) TaxID=732165 RepID=R7SUQ3_DICSQ|nr:uncharacterized protein DICSQDRAFT_128148 [Dichomitus squalens LYAD-421 SS1]EJF59643.1 hypothetical protein DICSQDRAFT_128148 [Dichomitus squalens LYAD-421 SS1]